jgi:Tfp pilus assembly protein PilF
MRRLHGLILLALLAVSSALGQATSPEEEFNRARLRSGQDLYEEKRYREAIDQFRVAAFGYLDRPAALSECLVRLALAQAAAGKPAEADVTLNRFMSLERRFPSYAQASLQPEIRSAFQALLSSRLPEAAIVAVPSLASLIETEEQKIAKLPPTERKKAYEAAAKREPGAIRWPVALAREALERGNAKEADRWAEKAMTLDNTDPEAIAVRARARAARGDHAGALKDLAALPAEEMSRRPELYADKLVSLVEAKEWPAAEEAARGLPVGLDGRADVMRAMQKLLTEQQRRSKEAAGARTAAAPKPPPPKEAAPRSGGSRAGSSAAPTDAGSGQNKSGDAGSASLAVRNREVLAESRRLVSSGKAGEAEKILTEAVKADPANRDLRLALLEATCLARSYQKGAAQVPLVLPFTDAEAAPMFYAAVVLYETGRGGEARDYFERALPRVSGPLVDEYSKKILERR